MNLKKTIALVLAVALALTLFVGCGSSNGAQSEAKSEAAAAAKSEAPVAEKSEAPAAEKSEAPAAEKSEAPAEEKSEEPKETITISFAHDKPTTHNVHLRFEKWAEDLNKATDGQVEIEFYPAQSLVTLGEAYEGVVNGVVDITVITPALCPGIFPMLELFDLPCVYNNATVLSQVYWDCIQKYMPAELDNLHVLSVYCMGPGALAANTPITTMEELKGKQIRAVGLNGECVGALGASPVSVAMPETYEALYRGVADGVLCGLGAMTTWKLVEVCDNLTLTPMLGCSAFLIVMNNDVWNGLPADVQEAFTETFAEWSPAFVQGEEDEATMALDSFVENGTTMNFLSDEEIDKWMEAMQPTVDKAIEARESAGPAREWYETMQELAAQYNETAESYEDYYNSIAK